MIISDKIGTSKLSAQVESILSNTINILESAQEIKGFNDESVVGDLRSLSKIPGQIESGRLRVAVVGVIKSGKSTFVNSVIGKEVVKRGAGVMTSITTRIKKGPKKQALLYFKSWDEINTSLQEVLELFPNELVDETHDKGNDSSKFDIRRQKDRNYLEQVYKSLITGYEDLFQDERPELLLIHHALNGYELCKDRVGAEDTCHVLEASDFDTHTIYTADPDKAFYIKDVCLELPGKEIDPNIEIADCQGADSTDPAQLAHVLNYIESVNIIIYCISSRTGLRKADMDLLQRIKRIGLLDHVLFVNNCDLSEHENLVDLTTIEERVKQDLLLLNIEPEIFSFSTLLSLFSAMGSGLQPKDKARVDLWQSDTEMVNYCDEQKLRFHNLFIDMLENDRHKLLVLNHLNRIKTIIVQLERRAEIFHELLSSDQLQEEKALKAIKDLHQNASRLEIIVSNSLSSAVEGFKEQASASLNSLFQSDRGDILKGTLSFIDSISLDVEQYRPIVKDHGFKKILYLIFQDFKKQVDLYSLEKVQPEIRKYINEQEEQISAFFLALFDSYQIDLMKSDLYRHLTEQAYDYDFIDFKAIKTLTGIQVPVKIFRADFSSVLKLKVFSGFWFQTFSDIVAGLMKQKAEFSFSPVLSKIISGIKKDNKRSFKSQFKTFGTTLNDSYFTPLIDAAIRDFEEKMQQRFRQYESFKQEAENIFSLNEEDKKNKRIAISALKEQTQQVMKSIISAMG